MYDNNIYLTTTINLYIFVYTSKPLKLTLWDFMKMALKFGQLEQGRNKSIITKGVGGGGGGFWSKSFIYPILPKLWTKDTKWG